MQSIIIEIRAGAGGEEAALFANDLFKMYSKYAVSRNWSSKTLDTNYTGLGGIKQITFELKGENVLDRLKYEAGVHRVQRVPKTEKSNRLHTSTVSVAVLEKPKMEDIDIKASDIKMDFFKSSGHGGQNVNKRMTAIRITHMPTGLIVTSQTQRNLEQNKASAMAILQAKLYKAQRENMQNAVAHERKSQIGTADRAEKIRTYNFPQDRITDHRIKKSFHNIEKILDGKMDKMIEKIERGSADLISRTTKPQITILRDVFPGLSL